MVEDKTETGETSSRQEAWNKVKSEMVHTGDVLGRGIDEGIMESVIALNVFKINTIQSCEGHIDEGVSAPWIRFAAPNEPNERFVGQNEIFEKVAEKYKMPVEETKRMFNMDAFWEAYGECEKNAETEDFKKWKLESVKILHLIKAILDDFYSNREVPDNIKIKVSAESLEDMTGGFFEISNGGEDNRIINGIKMSEEEKESLSKRLIMYREEMMVFANFLKEKFFSVGENYVKDVRINQPERVI